MRSEPAPEVPTTGNAFSDPESRYRAIYDNISEGIYRSSLDGRQISANPSLVRLNGYGSEAEMLAAVNDIASEWYVDLGRRATFRAILHEKGHVQDFVSEIYRHKTRERIWVNENAHLVRDPVTDEPLFYEGTVREVTETIRRLELQERHEKIAAVVPGCMYQFRRLPDGALSVPYASAGFANLFGFASDLVRDDAAAIWARVHPDDREALTSSTASSARDLSRWHHEFRIVAADGSEKWLFGNALPEREADGSTLWNGFITDVTERKRAEARIHDLAFFDPLTRLPNRRLLLDRTHQALASSRRNGSFGALFFVDLDNFKLLNDTKGHDVGDLLLVEIGERLRTCLRATDTAARLGGDEFVLLAPDIGRDMLAAETAAEAIASKVLAIVDRPCLLRDHLFQTSPSIGVTLFQGQGRTVEELLKNADLAMYEAKAAGRNAVRFFDPRIQAKLDARMSLMSDLRGALAGDDFALHLQAQVDASDRVFGAEALLRWRHPGRGQVNPSEFLALAEETGLIVPIGDWIMERSCEILKSWEGDGRTGGLRLAVNVGAVQLRQPDFAAKLEAVFERTKADPRRLKLEITENAMLGDTETIHAVMGRLGPLGVTFALDDFGVGFSSLSHLKRLPFDEVKIDRSFVRDVETDANDRAIVQAIVRMAETLGLAPVAEGIETAWQRNFLRGCGCPSFQGYLFGRPMPRAEFEATLPAKGARGIKPRREDVPHLGRMRRDSVVDAGEPTRL